MAEFCFWSVILVSGLLVGAAVATRVPVSQRVVTFLLAFTGDVLATTVGISLIDPNGRSVGESFAVAGGIVAGALLIYSVTARMEKAASSADKRHKEHLFVLGRREVAMNAPEFLAFGALGFGDFGQIDVIFVLAVYLSNYTQAIPATIALRKAGFTSRQIYGHWIAVSVTLVATAMISFAVFRGASEPVRAVTLALAAGAMLATLSAEQPEQNLSTASRGFLTSLRFGLAFLIVSLLSVES